MTAISVPEKAKKARIICGLSYCLTCACTLIVYRYVVYFRPQHLDGKTFKSSKRNLLMCARVIEHWSWIKCPMPYFIVYRLPVYSQITKLYTPNKYSFENNERWISSICCWFVVFHAIELSCSDNWYFFRRSTFVVSS